MEVAPLFVQEIHHRAGANPRPIMFTKTPGDI